MKPLDSARMSRISWLTSVSKMIGRPPSFSAALLICCTMARAFSAVSMYGRVSFVKVMFSNCARRLWPRVSAVMPVPSEMKKAVRFMCLGP